MKIEYKVIVRDGKAVEEQYFEDICCSEMKKALLNQETPLSKTEPFTLWLYCPFCKKEIECQSQWRTLTKEVNEQACQPELGLSALIKW